MRSLLPQVEMFRAFAARLLCASALAILLAIPGAFAATEAAVQALVYNLRLRTDSTPDLTDVESYLRSITSQFSTPQEKAIAIWRWSQRLREQNSNPAEDRQMIPDPITLFNSYGHCNCGVVSGLDNTFWLNMGWKAHYVQLGDHTVSETSWDGGKTWHPWSSCLRWRRWAMRAETEPFPGYERRSNARTVS